MDVRFGVDNDSDLYVVTKSDGMIRQVGRGEQPARALFTIQEPHG